MSDQREQGVISSVLSDKSSGLKRDSTGRTFFRQRKVRFQTISIDVEEIHSPALPGKDDFLPFLHWQEKETSHEKIRDFAKNASERFLIFWYSVFDVAVARGLSGRDREIYRTEIFERSTYADTGLPEDPRFSSVPPELHQKIIGEYKENLQQTTAHRIYYLSDYLHGLNRDLREAMRPYHRLWDLQEKRRQLLKEPDHLRSELERLLENTWQKGSLHSRVESIIDLWVQKAIQSALESSIQSIENERLRSFLLLRRKNSSHPLTRDLKNNILKYDLLSGVDPIAKRLHEGQSFPEEKHREIRFAMLHESMSFRAALREIARERRKNMEEKKGPGPAFSREPQKPGVLDPRNAILIYRYGEFLEKNGYQKNSRIDTQELAFFHSPRPEQGKDPAIAESPASRDAYKRLIALLKQMDEANRRLADVDRQLIEYHKQYMEKPVDYEEEQITGDPATEHLVVDRMRKILLQRLRPVRMTSSRYSTVAGHRHGAIPLNPILKLWKHKPAYYEKETPDVATFELNTRTSMDCLLSLAKIADPHLENRELQWRKTMKEKKGSQTLENALYFLLPGSAFPVREVHQLDFPEFRGKVIGESRTPVELGIDRSEDSILTGGWYNKSNHSFYYTAGGDNGSLLRVIWRSGRFSGPPAFFFALGQFVHDTIEDEWMYYKSSHTTFREMVEDYYRQEDRIRKNRGERTGRRKIDNTRDGIRFMFASFYSWFTMEALTGSPQMQLRSRGIEKWMVEVAGIPVLHLSQRQELRRIRELALEKIQSSPANRFTALQDDKRESKS